MSDGYELEELTRIEAALDALVSPTSEDVFQATRPFDERAIASVAAQRAGSGGGGSQPLSWVGPFTVDWDNPNITDELSVVLTAIPAGTLVIAVFTETQTTWVSTGSPSGGAYGQIGLAASGLPNTFVLVHETELLRKEAPEAYARSGNGIMVNDHIQSSDTPTSGMGIAVQDCDLVFNWVDSLSGSLTAGSTDVYALLHTT